MNVTPVRDPFNYLLLDEVFTETELLFIWGELEKLNSEEVMVPPAFIYSASDEFGVSLRNSKGVFLDPLYQDDRSRSPILCANRKFFTPEHLNQADLWFFRHFKPTLDSTLVSYYEDKNYYKPHCDGAAATCLVWLYREPKKFLNGNLKFSDYSIELECKSNSGVIFPSQILHEVSTIFMHEKDLNKGLGRYCITTFMDYSFD